MATQLTRRRWREAFAVGAPAISIPKRYLVAAAALCVVLVYAAMIASIRAERTDLRNSEQRYLDAAQLLSVPPVPVATLQADVAGAKASLAWVEGRARHSTIDPASDDATELLVQRAQQGGLTVAGISRLAPALEKHGEKTYNVTALRLTVQGASPDAIIAFLLALEASDPGLIPSLADLSAQDAGARAELVFSVYTELITTPAAAAEPRR
jgi:hypothetical protein